MTGAMPPTEALVRVEIEGEIARLVIDRPEKRNALTPEMLAAMVGLIRTIPESARALLVEGKGAVFCAGFDLSLCVEPPDGSVMRALLTGLRDVIAALRALPIPVVLAAQGGAIAGGCALLGGADVVVSDAGAKIGYPVVRLGVSPGVSAPYLFGATGPGPARAMQLDPGLISGTRARELGVVHQCMDRPEEVVPAAARLAGELARKPRGGMAATKAWLMELEGLTGDDRGARALETSISLTGGAEERELLARALARPGTKV
jgi:enoyl-CoA hydratase/carnithine racemase